MKAWEDPQIYSENALPGPEAEQQIQLAGDIWIYAGWNDVGKGCMWPWEF